MILTLANADTIRCAFAFDAATVERMKQITGAEWRKPAWYLPISKLDRLIETFPDQIEAHPDVFLSAPPRLLGETFVANLRAAGVELTDIDGRIVATGGVTTPNLQAEIDRRSAQIRRYIGAKPAIPAEQVTTGEYASRATDADRAYFAGVVNARKAAEKQEARQAKRNAERYGQLTMEQVMKALAAK